MIVRDYNGTLDGLYDIVREMSLRVRTLEQEVRSIKDRIESDDDEVEEIIEEFITL